MKLLFKPWNSNPEGWDVDFAILALNENQLKTLNCRRELAAMAFKTLANFGHSANELKFFDSIACPLAYEGLADLLPEALWQFVAEGEYGQHLIAPDDFNPETIPGIERVPTDGHCLVIDADGDLRFTAANKYGSGKLELPLPATFPA